MTIADLLPQVRGILPLTDIDALNRLARTLCDVLETTQAVPPPAPVHEALAVPPLTPQEFLFSALLDGPQPAKAVERDAREQHGWSPQVVFKGPADNAREGYTLRLWTWGILVMETAWSHDG